MHWGKVVIHCLMLILIFLAVAIFVNPLTDIISNGTVRVVMKELLRIGITVGLLVLYVKRFFKKESVYFRVQKPFKLKKSWILLGLAIPFIVIAFYVLSQSVVLEKRVQLSLGTVLPFIIGSFITACSAGIIEEVLFRGYLFKILEEKWNVTIAVFVNSGVFGALHLLTGNGQQLLDICLTLIAGVLAGTMFSLIVYRTGSVWNAVVVHIIWNFFINSNMVKFVLENDKSQSSLILFRFKSDSVWITGGAFGIEASIPAILMYVLIIVSLAFSKPESKKDSIAL
ncbi:CPBP family intramembrane glutamic endopeptidase [Bacillus sp. B-jedd]|uniref:CPBP family intramembrane glutamic endopeptidase n=1 Tax=Bacillus sp. B-jedd TaxID=1476857 RepID=UPI00051559BF|nr:type II CAAX endopeptidase family protein [Bacillus sp. B-jedd]CEG29429.1 CAAX amino terminal protease family protein [Bacillus sp. B-jedd]